jgi:glycosyltransferase involved in cell wall biosynthesis
MIINKDVKVSIIVAAYNVEKFIKDCIESIITQTYSNFELIIVNDGSTDSTGDICNLFAKNDTRIKVIHQENIGLVKARQSGLKLASGKYILYIDGDDYVESSFCELLIKETYNFDADIVIGGYIRNYRGRMITVKNILPTGRYENDEIKKIWGKMIFTGDFFSHGISTYSWGKLFKRDILISIQMAIPSNITIGEDAACVYPYISICKKIAITNASNYHYVQHQSSMLKNSSNISEEINKLSTLFVYMLNFFKGHELYDCYYNQLKPYILSQLMIRTGGLINKKGEKNYLIGHEIDINDKIAIYNSGTFGQKLFFRLTSEKFENIIWIDEDADLCNEDNLPVKDPKILSEILIDKIFIASLNPIYIKRIYEQLTKSGILNDRIYYYNINDNNIDSLISDYEIDPNSFELNNYVKSNN